jgi:hypothetical protein
MLMKRPRSTTLQIALFIAFVWLAYSPFGCNEKASVIAPYPNGPVVTMSLSTSIVAPCETLLIDVQFINYSDTLIWIEYCCEPLRCYVTDMFGHEKYWCLGDTCAPCAFHTRRTVWPRHFVSRTFSFCAGTEELCMPAGIYVVHAGDELKQYPWRAKVFKVRD